MHGVSDKMNGFEQRSNKIGHRSNDVRSPFGSRIGIRHPKPTGLGMVSPSSHFLHFAFRVMDTSRLPLLLRAHGSMSCCNAYRGHRGKRAAYCWSSPIAASETFSAIWRRSLLASAGPAHSSTRTSSPAGSRQRTSCQSGTSPGEWGAINRGKGNRGD
jgi:hypothetical protein